MFDDDFFSVLTQARNRVLYENYKNSLVEWTLSNNWTDPSSLMKNGRAFNGKITGPGRVSYMNIVSGEINL